MAKAVTETFQKSDY